ncbi:hypothetical protein C6A77_19240 [Pseudomonas sp. AFG_SD02_1510_Pfu_092]|uniref:hypothetical protein n=1 Tax=Pseudomonas sp. AFG_SD02_1510_Pfu_092 TaxID=2259497 RepID=UPI000DEF85C1|nr:hypothetical protein [Pseudomonas sp. AFG_SD02_1510_Pfu_092]RCL22975.1 hypothetical protein C6A77_19240 [Pseudomonas sp. AFG_SD02_1510_Pfu_092]
MSQLETLPAKPDRFTVAKLIEQQIDQVYDRFRMRQAWERVAANIDPAEMAEGLCMALSHGGFARKQAAPQVTLNIIGQRRPQGAGQYAQERPGHRPGGESVTPIINP